MRVHGQFLMGNYAGRTGWAVFHAVLFVLFRRDYFSIKNVFESSFFNDHCRHRSESLDSNYIYTTSEK